MGKMYFTCIMSNKSRRAQIWRLLSFNFASLAYFAVKSPSFLDQGSNTSTFADRFSSERYCAVPTRAWRGGVGVTRFSAKIP